MKLSFFISVKPVLLTVLLNIVIECFLTSPNLSVGAVNDQQLLQSEIVSTEDNVAKGTFCNQLG